jgi:hypothetical protein
MSGNCFVATITRIDAGATVTFLNEDDAAHMVTGANFSWGIGADGNEGAGELFKGDTFEQTFADSGVYPYFCILHPSMVGAVVVGDGVAIDASAQLSTNSGAFASTGAQGRESESATAPAAAQNAGSDRGVTMALVACGFALLVGLVAVSKTIAARRVGGA